MTRTASALFFATCLTAAGTSRADDRDAVVKRDRAELAESEIWVYNDLDRAIAEAQASGKPVCVVFR